ncbi:MAG: hypothetical protein M0Z67_15560 [Nitrospiraceae bacterium]|nr:hypothetical protein [Nitrospiraceae bacterium]
MKIRGNKTALILTFTLLVAFFAGPWTAQRADAAMSDYCVTPPFVTQSVPPLVMLIMGRDHKDYYQAYNDASDLDGDGQLDTTYNHSIVYYGYFDPDMCYTHSGGTGSNDGFSPAGPATGKFCTTGQWSGNILNWLTMSKMDVIRKVFYGGHRSTDSNSSVVLERAFIPQDAHSWGKEVTGRLCWDGGSVYTNQCSSDSDCNSGYTCVDKSVNLIGIAAASGPTQCTPIPKVCSNTTNKTVGTICASDADCTSPETCIDSPKFGQMILVQYDHSPSTNYPATHTDMLNSYEPGNLHSGYPTYITDFNATQVDPTKNHGDNFNYLVMADFDVTGNSGTWQFAVDGDDAVEVEIDGVVVANFYGAHGSCNCQTHFGSIVLNSANGINGTSWHRLIARHFERSGNDGVKVWYKRPGDTKWSIFGQKNNQLNIKAPNITPGNECNVESGSGAGTFIGDGTLPTTPFTTGNAKRHLFCSTSLGDGPSYSPLLRLLTNRSNRIWEWSAKERPVCDNSLGTPTDYAVRVNVCTATDAAANTDYFKKYCKLYPGGGGTYKPIGLLQKYGESDGTKVCSKQFTKACNTNSDCVTGEGICMDRVKMLFGLLSGSYDYNLSGGVLRKNVWSILDETNVNDGTFQTSENVEGNIINTLERMKVVGYSYSSYSYDCGWIETRQPNEGECKMWGNPIGEMMYEATRYFADKGAPTADFMYPNNADGGLNLSKLGVSNKPWIAPYDQYPACSRPFMLVFSDISPSYDSDKIPGSSFSSFTGDLTGLNATTEANIIGTSEGLANTSEFIGQNGATTDFLCSAKNISNLGNVRGLCPYEPNKQGSYYSAAVAYYAKEMLKTCTNSQTTVCTSDSDCATPAPAGKCVRKNISTYSVALPALAPELTMKIGGKSVKFIPAGKSVSGCLNVDQACANKCTLNVDQDCGGIANSKGLQLCNCSSTAFCPSNQLVNMFVDRIIYDSSGNVTYAKFRINFEDSEQGADHDMDAIVTYEISVDPTDPTNKIIISLSSDYAAGCINQVLGFVISGTTEDGVYLPVRDADSASAGTGAGSLPLNWEHTFTTTGTSVQSLKDPLWYAAKWGGFEDADNDASPPTPNLQSEWDKDNNGTPDTYFLAVNPLKIEEQLEAALLAILRRASSGTAASVLASGEGSGANLAQAIFYPKKMFDAANTELSWIGTLQNYWYYLDPSLSRSTIREDTIQDRKMKLDEDYIVNFFFDDAEQRTKARRNQGDAQGNIGAQQPTVYIENLKNLWEAGLQLWNTPAASRTIYTNCGLTGGTCISGTGLLDFSTANKTTLRPYLNAASDAEAEAVIRYTRGEDTPFNPAIAGFTPDYRSRTTAIDLNGDNQISGAAESPKVWKLGDIVNSTPRIVSWIPVDKYDQTYNDSTYKEFVSTSSYKKRGTIITGANDGMLHAFKLGLFQLNNDNTSLKAVLCDDANGNGVCDDGVPATDTLGTEQWAFIPGQTLPYLKYLADKDYCHIYSVDATPFIVDASVGIPSACTETDYWKCAKTADSWRTILIGSMRYGAACRKTGSGCSNCVNTPITDPADNTKGLGFSSYFALDITDPTAPKKLWEFTDPTLGFSTSGPAVLKIKARTASGSVSIPDDNKNGRWFVVLASGPTGPIDTGAHQFMGTSDQPLSLFILDLKTGVLATPKITMDGTNGTPNLPNAFSGSLVNGNIDFDHDYQDDAVYFGYTKLDSAPNTWTQGGILRLLTKEDLNGADVSATGNTALNPANWQISTAIDDIGSVSAAVVASGFIPTGASWPASGWLFFGSGRYFYKGDDNSTQRMLFGMKDPCFSKFVKNASPPYLLADTVCSATDQYALSELDNTTIDVHGPSVTNGWYVKLESPTNTETNNIEGTTMNVTSTAERLITDPLVTPSGAVFFTTFEPSADICQYGGNSFLWALKWDTGSSAAAAGILQGQAFLQVSTGQITNIDLGSAFVSKIAIQHDPPPLRPPPPTFTPGPESAGRRTGAINGMPPGGQGLTVVVAPKPIQSIMHIRKR